MNKLAFLYDIESSRSKYLLEVLSGEYDVIVLRSYDEINNFFKESFNTIDVLIVDNPSSKKYIEDLLKNIESRNNYMFSLPVILLTDSEHHNGDDKYLSDIAVGIINEGESKKTVLQRIKNVISFSNSRSFDDFSNMLKALPSLIYLKGTDGRYAFCSQNWHHLTNPGESIRGLTDFDIRKDKENARIAQEADKMVVKSGKGMSYVIKEEDDEGIDYLQIIKEPLKNEKGEVTGIIAIINNVTDSELLRQELRQKSITDQLTGLYNRAYFEELAKRFKENMSIPLTIITADCDGLKKINDKYGHAAGDKYICFARDAMKESLPELSFLFRMGGDEFVAIIPEMKKYDAAKLVKEIVNNSKKYKTNNFSLKLSVGSYTIIRKNISIETGMALSDREMYKMKNKNRK